MEDEVRIAVIDIGTNSVLLTICSSTGNEVVTLLDHATITRLGERAGQENRLTPAAMSRTVNAILQCLERCREMNVSRIDLISTNAVREADNREDFIRMVKEKTGFDLEVISGEEEARLSYLSVIRDPNLALTEPVAVVDIGGGSTELTIGTPPSGYLRSYPIGAVKITNLFLKSDPPTEYERRSARRYLDSAWDDVPGIKIGCLVGIGGTVTTLAAMECRLTEHHPDLINGMVISARRIDRMISRLCSLTLAERAHMPGLDPARADIIVGGLLILVSIMEKLGLNRVIVSSAGLRYGRIYEVLFGDHI